VVGVAQTEHGSPQLASQTVRDIVYMVTDEILRNVGMGREDVGAVVHSSSDYWQGMGCSNVFHFESAGAYLKDAPKVEDDSLSAFIQAYLRILSGHFDTALVVSVTKCSEAPPIPTLTNLYAEPFFLRPVGINEVAAAALQCQLYCRSQGVTEWDRGHVVAKNSANASRNRFAHRRVKLSADDVMRSEVVAYPLRELECSPASDGASAVLLAVGEKARKLTDTPVWIRGVGWCCEEYSFECRDLTRLPALRKAATDAYRMANITNPRRQVDVMEVTEPYAHQEIMYYEELGLCRRGEEVKLLREGVTEASGALPVNPSGGVLSTNPYVARGLVRVVECVSQIMGEAGERQVEGAETALAHSTIGLAGQMHAVAVLGA